jgi:hypothetical protein
MGNVYFSEPLLFGSWLVWTWWLAPIIQKLGDKVIRTVTLSPTPYPLFQWYLQSKEILLNLSMKCWNSVFNAQGSKVIIIVVQVGAVKIYVAAVEALKKRERHDEIEFTTKIGGKTSLSPRYFIL